MHNNLLKIRMEKILELFEKGDKERGKELLDEVVSVSKNEINNLIDKDEDSVDGENINRSIFPKAGEVFAEGEKVRLIAIYDKEKYIATVRHYSQRKRLYDNESFVKTMWDDVCYKDCFACGIYLHDGKYIGYCFVDDVRHSTYEIAIELEPEYCNKGYGTEAIRIFIENVAKVTGKKKFYARVELDNYASQKMMKKVGGYPNGIRELLLFGEELEMFKEENKHLITDKMREVAKEFSMEAEEMLGYVLVYEFDLGKE